MLKENRKGNQIPGQCSLNMILLRMQTVDFTSFICLYPTLNRLYMLYLPFFYSITNITSL